MTTSRAVLAGLFFCVLAVLLAGCAVSPPQTPSGTTTAPAAYWRGRLALRVETPDPTSFFASFELSGHPEAGELVLSSPLGTTLARLSWGPQWAKLNGDGQTRFFESLHALAIEATGTDIPIAAMFQWLEGRPIAADGWHANLAQLAEGRLWARRSQPAPAAELRLILDQP